MTKVIFLALWANNNTQLNNDWSNVKYRMPEITLASGTNGYEMCDIVFGTNKDSGMNNSIYLVGEISYSGSNNWKTVTQYALTWHDGNNWSGTYSFVKGVTFEYKYYIAYDGDLSDTGYKVPEGGSNRSITITQDDNVVSNWQ